MKITANGASMQAELHVTLTQLLSYGLCEALYMYGVITVIDTQQADGTPGNATITTERCHCC